MKLIADFAAILRDKYVTGVKNQGIYSSCWAFATYGSLESCLLKKSEIIDKSKILEGAGESEYINLSSQPITMTGISIDEIKKI